MIPRIKSFCMLKEYQLGVVFDDGRVVTYDLKDDIRTIPDFRALETECGLFLNAQLDASRTCISWNDRIDLASDTIYEYGTEEDNGVLLVAEDECGYKKNGE
ncbi:MAG: DUF2442 domain-containing protein [Bacteroidaceae bacterium]|nr:DUF2442 domain-containing protein [Bacteroidaceae bacterium]